MYFSNEMRFSVLRYRDPLEGIRILGTSRAGKLLCDGISSSNRLINTLF